MVTLRTLLTKLVVEEQGTELVEYALLAGVIVISTIAAMQVMGAKVLARWNILSGASW